MAFLFDFNFPQNHFGVNKMFRLPLRGDTLTVAHSKQVNMFNVAVHRRTLSWIVVTFLLKASGFVVMFVSFGHGK